MHIVTMSGMRKLSEQYKIPGRSLPEIASRFDGVLSRQQNSVRRKFGDRKISAEALTNAIVLYFLDLTEVEQDMVLDRCLPELGSLLGYSLPSGVRMWLTTSAATISTPAIVLMITTERSVFMCTRY